MATKYEMSKTYQYRKVMKPLLERKRRARINSCLDDLKQLMAECMQQQSGDPNVKLEKADILELTVQHLRQLKTQRNKQSAHQSFRAGYIHAANEVSRCLATLPKVDIALGTSLMTHLGLRLNQLESAESNAKPEIINKPLRINCNAANTCTSSHQTTLYSPISSGYESDGDSSRSSCSMGSSSQGLLQLAAPVWRPW